MASSKLVAAKYERGFLKRVEPSGCTVHLEPISQRNRREGFLKQTPGSESTKEVFSMAFFSDNAFLIIISTLSRVFSTRSAHLFYYPRSLSPLLSFVTSIFFAFVTSLLLDPYVSSHHALP